MNLLSSKYQFERRQTPLDLSHRNTDKDALMCQTSYCSSPTNAIKLRKAEWDVIN